MNVWSIDMLRKRDGKLALWVHNETADRFESEEISSTARRAVIPAIRRMVGRLGRPDVIHTDHAHFWHGLPAAFGAAHRVCAPNVQSRLSLLERRFRQEDRA
jgi:hypothetical protein